MSAMRAMSRPFVRSPLTSKFRESATKLSGLMRKIIKEEKCSAIRNKWNHFSSEEAEAVFIVVGLFLTVLNATEKKRRSSNLSFSFLRQVSFHSFLQFVFPHKKCIKHIK